MHIYKAPYAMPQSALHKYKNQPHKKNPKRKHSGTANKNIKQKLCKEIVMSMFSKMKSNECRDLILY